MNTARFNLIAGRLAPKVKATAVDWQPSGSHVQLACGHSKQIVSHFHVKVGDELECYDCGADRARKLSEFNS